MTHLQNTDSFTGNQWLRRLWGFLPLISLALLVGAILVLNSWIHSEGEIIKEQKTKGLKEQQVPNNVVALALSPGPIRDQINLPAVVHPWVELQVVAEVRGKVVHKLVAEGQRVQKGTVLAKIDDRDYRNAFASARASYQAAKAAHDRIQRLYKQQVATRSQLDDVVTLLSTTRAAMDTAALNLERCEIRSPMQGVVDRMHIENGQYLNDGDPVARILQIDQVKIEVGIPESDVDAIRRVQQFKITIDALNGKTFKGKYHYLSKSADSLARTYRLEIAINNPDGEILPDMFARAQIVKKQVNDALRVPLYTLTPYKDAHAVFVADQGRARQVPVRIGIQEGWQVQIAEGLQAGDQVIVVGQRDISDGTPIKVLRTVNSIEEIDQ
jgi:RND family efflux transporter MFP subunit